MWNLVESSDEVADCSKLYTLGFMLPAKNMTNVKTPLLSKCFVCPFWATVDITLNQRTLWKSPLASFVETFICGLWQPSVRFLVNMFF